MSYKIARVSTCQQKSSTTTPANITLSPGQGYTTQRAHGPTLLTRAARGPHLSPGRRTNVSTTHSLCISNQITGRPTNFPIPGFSTAKRYCASSPDAEKLRCRSQSPIRTLHTSESSSPSTQSTPSKKISAIFCTFIASSNAASDANTNNHSPQHSRNHPPATTKSYTCTRRRVATAKHPTTSPDLTPNERDLRSAVVLPL